MAQITTQKTKDRAPQAPLKIEGDHRCSGGKGGGVSSCFSCGTRRVTLVRNPVISHECGKNRKYLQHYLPVIVMNF